MDANHKRARNRQRGRSSASRAGSSRAHNVKIVGLGLAWLASVGAAGCSGDPELASEPPERIVVVTIDTLRADHVGAYGATWAITPGLDSLASDGVRFAVVNTPAPVTLPSHTSLFSGQDPGEHGVRHNGLFQVGPDVPLLADRLRQADFETAAFIGSFVLDRRFGLDRGFAHYDDKMSVDRGTAGALGFSERTADRVVDAALAWLENAPPRFFVWTHFFDPHADYQAPTGFSLALPGRPYDAEIAFADSQLRRLIEAVEARWPDGKTLFVVTSDHGESLGEHGEATHSYLLYEGTQRVPLLMRGPGIPAGRVVDGPVRLIDVAPTILAMLGLPPMEGASGEDLWPQIAGGTPDPPVTYMEALAPHFDFGWRSLVGVRQGRFKLIQGTEMELYDLDADPGEMENLAQAQPETVERLAQEIAWRIEKAGAPSPTRGLEEEERQRLVALGYLLPDAAASPADGWLEGADPRKEVAAIHRVSEAGTLVEQARWSEALAAIEGLDDGDLPRWVRAAALLGLGRLEEAEVHARAAIVPGAPGVGPRVMLGRVLAAQGRYEEALAEFAEAEARAPHDPVPPLAAGRASLAWGRREEAKAAFERAASGRGTKSAEARRELAALALDDGDCAEADHWLADETTQATAWRAEVQLALAEARAGRHAAAVKRIEQLIQSGEGLPILWSALASILEGDGDRDGAIAAREQALKAAPGEDWARNDLAYSLAAAGQDLDRALELAGPAASSEDPNALDTLAFVHLARGEAAEALGLADRALALDPGGEAAGHLQLIRARALVRLGRRSDARVAAKASAASLEERPEWAGELDDVGRQLSIRLEIPEGQPPACG